MRVWKNKPLITDFRLIRVVFSMHVTPAKGCTALCERSAGVQALLVSLKSVQSVA